MGVIGSRLTCRRKKNAAARSKNECNRVTVDVPGKEHSAARSKNGCNGVTVDVQEKEHFEERSNDRCHRVTVDVAGEKHFAAQVTMSVIESRLTCRRKNILQHEVTMRV